MGIEKQGTVKQVLMAAQTELSDSNRADNNRRLSPASPARLGLRPT